MLSVDPNTNMQIHDTQKFILCQNIYTWLTISLIPFTNVWVWRSAGELLCKWLITTLYPPPPHLTPSAKYIINNYPNTELKCVRQACLSLATNIFTYSQLKLFWIASLSDTQWYRVANFFVHYFSFLYNKCITLLLASVTTTTIIQQCRNPNHAHRIFGWKVI